MIEIRPAALTDLNWLLEEMRAFAAFVGTKHEVFPPEEEAREIVKEFIEKHFCFITEYRALTFTKRTGFTIAVLHEQLFNKKLLVLTELFWWVVPESRGTRSGALLLQELERVAMEHRVNWMALSLERHSPVRPETLVRRGFNLWETTYLKEF